MSDVMKASVVGTDNNDVMKGGWVDELLQAGKGNDVVWSGDGSDVAYGARGNDTLYGQTGNDVLYGGGSGPSLARLDQLVIGQDYKGSITFEGENAGRLNTLGWYKVSDGKIVDVQVAWSNASLKDSGGNLLAGDSKPLDLHAGDQLGFFLISAGSSMNDFSKFTKGHYEFRDAEGHTATLKTVSPQLWFVPDTGKPTLLRGDDFHSAAYADTLPLNSDGIVHTVGVVDPAAGKVHVGFEDIAGGGDRDFDDSVFSVNIGAANVKTLIANGATQGGSGIATAKPYVAGTENDLLYGGDGNDGLHGRTGNDRLYGENGDDVIQTGTGNDIAYGGAGNDDVQGEAGNDTLYGDAGNDVISGGTGNDIAYGGDGNDNVQGDAGNDTLYGDAGNDVIDGGSGNDLAYGGAGDDKIAGGDGNDSLAGGDGNDSLSGGSDDDSLSGDAGNDILDGGSGNDRLSGGEGDDKLFGGSGNDSLSGDNGNDTLDGGAGDDTLNGGGNDDSLVGGSGNDVLNGDAGNDVLVGGSGNDVLTGGAGKDVLTGGEGADNFVFKPTDGKASADLITDFAIGQDHIDVSAYHLAHGAKDISFSVAADGVHVTLDTGASGLVDIATVKGPHDMTKLDHDSFIV